MVDDESSRPSIASGRRTSESENAHDRGPFELPDQIAAQIAEELRHSGVPCETVIPVPTQTAVLRRDRIVIVLALTLLTALAWSYLLWLPVDMGMGEMDMGGMDMGFRMISSGMGLMVPAHTPWLPIEFAFVFVMWTVMMVGMMTPLALPMFLMYARVGRQTEEHGRPLAATAWFATGYFLVWTAFALLITSTQWVFERAAMLDFKMASTSTVVAGLLAVAAGSYQWTKLKDICLAECQTPFAFLIRHGGFRRDAAGCLMLGLRLGAYCVGSCWLLMTLLFVGGAVDVPWIVLLALLILLEEVTSFGRQIAPAAGVILVAAGAWLLLTAIS
jgi:predicted metal-binding membrane protein